MVMLRVRTQIMDMSVHLNAKSIHLHSLSGQLMACGIRNYDSIANILWFPSRYNPELIMVTFLSRGISPGLLFSANYM